MLRLLAVLVLAGASVSAQTITQTFGTGANAFSIDFVEIGNPGNAPDDNGRGSVGYVYNIGKYEISRDHIEKANTEGLLGITLADMSAFGGNISTRPASGINWYEAATFVNWLNVKTGNQAAYKFDSTGNFQVWDTGLYDGTNQFRHKDAYYFLPSRDEWYKSAYYDSNKLGGSGYWKFPTASDSAPTAASGGTLINTAVYDGQSGPADVTDAGGLSAYGTMGQGGNVREWTESAFDGGNDMPGEIREHRGGVFSSPAGDLSSEALPWNAPTWGNGNVGFRVASVPEPSSLSLLLAGGAVLMAGRRRK